MELDFDKVYLVFFQEYYVPKTVEKNIFQLHSIQLPHTLRKSFSNHPFEANPDK